jgi:nitroimidazol reductase NimA-like FMN-containing flavoprotein (pyridoxamine 5'-phosphate oxidase superfamily)
MTDRERIPSKTKKGTIPIPGRLRALNENQYFGVLATNDKGQPYTSLISFAMTPDLKTVIFATPKDTRKFKNILNTGKVSILIDNRSGSRKNLMATEAITVIGNARHVPKGRTRDQLAAIFLEKHPDLEAFVQSDTTALIAVKAACCIHVGKFQTISVWDCSRVGHRFHSR